MNLDQIIGAVIREERMNRSLSYRQMNIKSKVSLGFLFEVEHGYKQASAHILQAIVEKGINLSLSEFFQRVTDKLATLEEGNK